MSQASFPKARRNGRRANPSNFIPHGQPGEGRADPRSGSPRQRVCSAHVARNGRAPGEIVELGGSPRSTSALPRFGPWRRPLPYAMIEATIRFAATKDQSRPSRRGTAGQPRINRGKPGGTDGASASTDVTRNSSPVGGAGSRHRDRLGRRHLVLFGGDGPDGDFPLPRRDLNFA